MVVSPLSLIVFEPADVIGRDGRAEMNDRQPSAGASRHLGFASEPEPATDQLGHRFAQRARGVSSNGQGLTVEVLGQIDRGPHSSIIASLHHNERHRGPERQTARFLADLADIDGSGAAGMLDFDSTIVVSARNLHLMRFADTRESLHRGGPRSTIVLDPGGHSERRSGTQV
jgi:hypothetical protein